MKVNGLTEGIFLEMLFLLCKKERDRRNEIRRKHVGVRTERQPAQTTRKRDRVLIRCKFRFSAGRGGALRELAESIDIC